MNDVIDGETVLNLRPDVEKAARALERIQPELRALDGDKLAVINVDIPRAVVTVLGALPALLALRPRILEELPRFPISSLDNLQTYALGAWYAHLLTLPPVVEENAKKPLVEEATTLRKDLLVAAEALAHRNLVDPKHVAQIRSGQGHIDMAGDLVALATLFANNWDAVSNKTAVTLEEVERAAVLGPQLLAAIGIQQQGLDRSPTQLADQRRRAFTLLVRAYDECRRAVTYLRWAEGDVAALVPSLFAKRAKPKTATSSTNVPPLSEDADSGSEAPQQPAPCSS
mgnify:CR=1 FL=1